MFRTMAARPSAIAVTWTMAMMMVRFTVLASAG